MTYGVDAALLTVLGHVGLVQPLRPSTLNPKP